MATCKTGQLKSIGLKRQGHSTLHWYTCVDCDTNYPVIDGVIRCNGHIIGICPWCRSDSEPFKNGRGI